MVPKRCLICCGESFREKTGTQDANSASFLSAENFHRQKAEATNNGDTELRMIFLLRKLLEIPEETCCLLREHFGKASVWIECCDSCLDLVEKCKAALEQAELFQKQFEELRSNIKTTMLKSPKKPFSAESKCEAIVRSHLITQEIENFINATVVEADEEIFSEGNANSESNKLTAPVGSQDTQVLIGSATPVLFERINVKNEDGITSFKENDDMVCSSESTDFGNNIKSGYTLDCEQDSGEIIQSDNLRKSANHNFHQFAVSPKQIESSLGNTSSLNTTEEEEPAFSKRDDKGDIEKKHECHICLQLFKFPQELRIHLLRSHSSTETDTKAVIKRTKNLRKHHKKHSAEKKHKCDICEKTFAKFSHLKNHGRIHSGEKPFVCDICGKGLTEASSLERHYRWHSGDKPYECDVCGKAFLRKDNLRDHQLRHIGNNRKRFECETCGKGYLRKPDLKKHQTTHSEKKPFKCDICDSSFKLKRSMTHHHKKHDEKTS